MADRVMHDPMASSAAFKDREAVCIHTKRVFDSCRDKDCIEDLRVYPAMSSCPCLEGACSVRPRSAELIYVDVNVDEVTFNRGFYTVDVKYYYRVRGTVFPGGFDIVGLSVFDKRVILYGSEGGSRVFTSNCAPVMQDIKACASLPTAVVEAVDPLALGMKVVDPRCCTIPENELCGVPEFIYAAFGEEIDFCCRGPKLYVTLGQFSIIRLERDAQILVPSCDYCIPNKECSGSSSNEDDPCTLFSRIPFPLDEFFPPDNNRSCNDDCGCHRD